MDKVGKVKVDSGARMGKIITQVHKSKSSPFTPLKILTLFEGEMPEGQWGCLNKGFYKA